jgi:hypothetical protein
MNHCNSGAAAVLAAAVAALHPTGTARLAEVSSSAEPPVCARRAAARLFCTCPSRICRSSHSPPAECKGRRQRPHLQAASLAGPQTPEHGAVPIMCTFDSLARAHGQGRTSRLEKDDRPRSWPSQAAWSWRHSRHIGSLSAAQKNRTSICAILPDGQEGRVEGRAWRLLLPLRSEIIIYRRRAHTGGPFEHTFAQ